MSVLNVNRIVDSSGGVFAPVSSVHKNRIINGQMTIDQRNAGASVTITSGAYPVDRFFAVIGQGSGHTAQRSTTATTGFNNSLLITVGTGASPTAGTVSRVYQPIEGFNVADLGWGTANASTVTLSFWVRSSLTGTFGGGLYNNAANRTYPFTYTINSANTFEYKSVTITGDTSGTWLTDNGAGIIVNWDLGSGSTYQGTAGAWAAGAAWATASSVKLGATSGATFYITGVQLEKGTQATSFEYRQYGQELALCQRYYQQFGGAASRFPLIQLYAANTNFPVIPISLVVQMRSEPTVTKEGTWATANCTQPSVLYNSSYGISVGFTMTATGLAEVYPNSTDDKITISAEL